MMMDNIASKCLKIKRNEKDLDEDLRQMIIIIA